MKLGYAIYTIKFNSTAKWLLASRSAVVTLNGSIGGGILGVCYSFLFRKWKLDVAIFINGILGGLVGITAICAVCRPWEAFIIGFIGGLVACGSCDIIDRLVSKVSLLQLHQPDRILLEPEDDPNVKNTLRGIAQTGKELLSCFWPFFAKKAADTFTMSSFYCSLWERTCEDSR